MDEEHGRGGQDMWRRASGTGGDMPTGYRPCPFCHAVIPWGSERCPACGRVLIERVGASGPQTPQGRPYAPARASWWARQTDDVKRRLRRAALAVQGVGRSVSIQINRILRGAGPSDLWRTTSRGTSWSVFQPAGRSVHSWWPRSLPRPTGRERQVLIGACILMIILFLAALLSR